MYQSVFLVISFGGVEIGEYTADLRLVNSICAAANDTLSKAKIP